MKLHEIKNKISSLPTVMDLSDELMIIENLMAIEFNDLTENAGIFKSIISLLALSHTDSGFMDLTKENKIKFIGFFHWLRKVEDEFNLGLNHTIIDSFSLTVEDIKKLMP
jgi:hypothetical protein